MLKFNNNNIVTGEIKQKLKEFNLPTLKVYKEGMAIFNNCFYLKDGDIYKGKQDGTLKFHSRYNLGEKIDNLTTNLVITGNTYDTYTHIYLGDFLRFYRDTSNINLMSMYNCFSNTTAKNMKIETSTISFNTENNNYKIYAVPIRWYNSYTISMDVPGKAEFVVGTYKNNSLITNYSEEVLTKLYTNTHVKTAGLRFNSPFLYNKVLTPNSFLTKELLSQEKNLTLFIKVPATSNSTVVVLEGDYTKSTELHFGVGDVFAVRHVVHEICNHEAEESLERIRGYYSRNQLLSFNSTNSYPFSDRLIEYLFDNVITPDDTISNNIYKLQKRLVQRGDAKHIRGTGTTFSNPIRNIVYDIAVNSNVGTRPGANKFDLLGYVDKDTEVFIGELEEVTK